MTDPVRTEEIEFRDGKRQVADYLVRMMSGLETHRMTYEEACVQANRNTEADWLNTTQNDLVQAHFRELR